MCVRVCVCICVHSRTLNMFAPNTFPPRARTHIHTFYPPPRARARAHRMDGMDSQPAIHPVAVHNGESSVQQRAHGGNPIGC